MVPQTFKQYIYFMSAMLKTQKKELYKSIIDNGCLMGEKIYVYIKYIHLLELNNI